ncbi:hypothetical protein [Rhizobium phaseoli]|uniref:hypothetical protein n=1 Tax=Rhizobium phaseoli TaxID=396 RepID=UPI0013DECA91|nr:hypothetical protein [Rhizobium phaseoli]
MTRITRRRLLAGVAAASLPVALPAEAAGLDDVSIVRMLIDAHKAAVGRWDDLAVVWPDEESVALWEKLSAEKDDAAAAVCFYRPTTIEGVHAKAEYIFGCEDFVDQEANDDWTRAELVSGFLPPVMGT